jgi:hypothetical protein
MSYTKHLKTIKEICPNLDLLKESEFDLFANEEFGLSSIGICLELCESASNKLKIPIKFAVQYNQKFNASAISKNEIGIILFNLGLIDKLKSIVDDSIDIFCLENVASLTITEDEKSDLKTLFSEICITYIFYHELCHILQIQGIFLSEVHHFQEEYSDEASFILKHHLYEMDADLFGVSMVTTLIINYIYKKDNSISTLLLFNLLTALLFSIANIIIVFSGNQFVNIYYKEKSHPHPLLRIIKCNEQILSFVKKNLKIQEEFLFAVLQRTIKMISQLKYIENHVVNYEKLYEKNMENIDLYIKETERMNESFPELIRHRSQEVFNLLYR